jgi:hypothetical protein
VAVNAVAADVFPMGNCRHSGSEGLHNGADDSTCASAIATAVSACRHPRPLPAELAWNYVKPTGTMKTPLTLGGSLEDRIEADLQAVRENLALVGSFFKAPRVAYVTD